MDLKKIQELLKIVSESGVAEVEIEEDDFKLTIRQNAPTVMMQPAQPSYSMPYPVPYGMPQQAPQGMASAPAAAPNPGTASANSPAASQSTASQAANGTANTAATADEQGGDAEVPTTDGHTVTAELVGTFYRASSPDADPFVSVGDQVAKGDVLCIIEAMKIMNEIESDVDGVVRKILVDDAEPVEFDQPLFLIEPA